MGPDLKKLLKHLCVARIRDIYFAKASNVAECSHLRLLPGFRRCTYTQSIAGAYLLVLVAIGECVHGDSDCERAF
mgnify:CR=1 FL=1